MKSHPIPLDPDDRTEFYDEHSDALDAIRADFRARKAAQRRDLGERLLEAGFALLIVGVATGLLALLLRLIP